MKMNPSPMRSSAALHAGGILHQAAVHRLNLAEEGAVASSGVEEKVRGIGRESVQAHPIAELLACPPEAGKLLAEAALPLNCQAGEVVFAQSTLCQGLYLVVSGLFLRRAERVETSLNLGLARSGELLELAAALGEARHTFTLAAQSAGSLMLLPIDALRQAFASYPPLRMHLLEELAREVSRAYGICALTRITRRRHAAE